MTKVLKFLNGSNRAKIDLFPVGYVYLSTVNTNPSTWFAGTWQQINGYYLYAGNTNSATSYTGANTQGHAITINQMPSHDHIEIGHVGSPVDGTAWANIGTGSSTLKWWDMEGSSKKTKTTGGDQAHAHNIATYQVFAFKRTS